ncbi:hypothetical protein TSAR_011592 [Trichomalopsis sarcophagae]|uniref:Uncharacterized protein n=1 Tax=Trichomalopsis sarcophagae TaxID=543379 RepID=A0A232ENY4_9HYME|nr:hypothetical protein TSAR_011592 [Trichomalopsis sarcophagae]
MYSPLSSSNAVISRVNTDCPRFEALQCVKTPRLCYTYTQRVSQLVRVLGVRAHLRYRTTINTNLNFSPSSLLFLLGPTDDCLDYSRQFQVGHSSTRMSVKSVVLRRLEEKCSVLQSRMERTSRLIQQHRDTYAELYEEREEVKRALDIMKSPPSIGPVNYYIPKLGDVCEVVGTAKRDETEEVVEELVQQQVHTNGDASMVEIERREEQKEEAQEAEEVEAEAVDYAAMQIYIREEFFQFDSYASPNDLADMKKPVVIKIEASEEDKTVDVV